MITVLVPLYNGIEYLEECLTSVHSQIYKDWTCIIGVNGHGPDGGSVMTRAISIVESLEDPRFRVINLPHVKGAPDAINALVAMSTTEWVAHLDADDKWHPMKLHCQISTIRDVDADIIGTFTLYFGDWKEGGPYTEGGYISEELFHKMNPMAHSSILIRRELAQYTNEFVGTYDYDCWLRNLVAGKKFYNVPLQLLYHRIHDGSVFNASGKQKPELVRQKYLGHL